MTYRFYYAVFTMGFVLIWAIIQLVILSSQQLHSNSYTFSLLLSGLLCVVVMNYPTRNPGIMSPPFILGGLTLVFYPAFSLIYMHVEELAKWYHIFFPMQFFQWNLAVVSVHYVLALVLFLVGYLFGEYFLGHGTVSRKSTATALGRNLALLGALMGMTALLFYAANLGGISLIIEQMSNMRLRREWRDTGTGLYYYIGMLLLTAPVVYFVLAFAERRTLSSVLPATLILLLASGVMAVTQASREKTIFPILLTVITLQFLVRGSHFSFIQKKVKTATVFLMLSTIIAFSVQTVFRWTREGYSNDISILQKLSDFNRVDISMVMFVDYFSETHDNELLMGIPIISYFNQFFVLIFDAEPILNTSALLHAFVFGGNSAAGFPGAPLAGELYLNFGYVGFTLFLVFGVFFGTSYKRLVASDFEPWRCLFFAAHLYFFMVKICIYIGVSESILMLLLTYVPLLLMKTFSKVSLQRSVHGNFHHRM